MNTRDTMHCQALSIYDQQLARARDILGEDRWKELNHRKKLLEERRSQEGAGSLDKPPDVCYDIGIIK